MTPPPTAPAAVEFLVDRLDGRKAAWVATSISDRIRYVHRAIAGIVGVADTWVAAGCAAQGVPTDGPVSGEIRMSGPGVTVRCLRLYAHALEHDGTPPLARRPAPGNREAARIFPTTLLDRCVFPLMTGEVWSKPGEHLTQGGLYREKAAGRMGPGGVSLVLGAGNIASIAPLDVMHELLVEDEVVVLKLNPVNEWLHPVLETAFADLIADGFLAIVPGGPEVGAALVAHPKVTSIHLTGAEATYDAIVWGADPEERARRKAEKRPVVSKRFTAELGCVTPVVVVPGNWSAGDLRFQARSIAGMLHHNASFNCNAAKAVVLAKGWPQRESFLAALREAIAALPPRRAYYPGAERRWRGFLERYPKAEILGARDEGVVPWTLIPNVPAQPGEYALTTEAFCGLLAVTELDAADTPTFLNEAVAFANHAIYGTLSCVILIDGKTRRAHRSAFERALAALRYGGIGVNIWTGLVYGLGNTSWGAFPGNIPEAIGSGVGAVHNGFMVDDPERSILYGPFRPPLKPIWFGDFKTADEVARRMLTFEAAPSLTKLPSLAMAALRA